jgi:hypothetical protein
MDMRISGKPALCNHKGFDDRQHGAQTIIIMLVY